MAINHVLFNLMFFLSFTLTLMMAAITLWEKYQWALSLTRHGVNP